MDYRQLAYQTAQKYGIDPDLFVRQIQAESAFRPDAVSSAGAIGLGQLMPATAKELGVDPTDPVQNLEGAARYMKQQLDRFGDPALALAAYNAGPSRVAKANGVPNITETQNYVAKILGGKGGAAMAQEPQKPQGLLGGLLGGQGIGGALGMRDDFRDKLAMAIMAGSGDPRLTPLIQQRAARMQERRGEAKEQRQRNKSIEFLKSRADAGDATAKEILGAVSTGALPIGTGVSTYLTQALTTEKDTRTQRQKDYEYAANVLKLPQDQAIQWAKSGTTVNVGGGADDFAKALMKEQAKRYETYQDAAGSARSVMENLDIMSSIVSQDDFYSGFGADTLNKAKRAAVAFGANPEGVKNAETFIKIAKDSALQAMGGSLGVGFSNADREFVEAMVPNISNTVEGNKLIIETQKRIQNRKIELAMFAEQYAAKNGNLSGFTSAVKDWAAQNPLFTEGEKQQLFGNVATPSAAGLSDEASSFLKKP